METKLKLGRILGIPVGLHWIWVLIFGLMSWSLALGYFPTEYPQLSAAAYWILGTVTSLLFFARVNRGLCWMRMSSSARRFSCPIASTRIAIAIGPL